MTSEYTPGASTELSDYVRMLRRQWRVILALVVLGAIVAGSYVTLQGPSYTASARVQIPAPTTTSSRESNAADVATEVAVMRSQPVAERAADLLGSEADPDGLLGRVSVSNPPDARVLEVSFTAGTPGEARRGAQAFADAYIATKQASADEQIESQVEGFQQTIDELQGQLDGAQAAFDASPPNSPARAAAQSQISRLTSALGQAQANQSEVATTPVDAGQILKAAEAPAEGDDLIRTVAIGMVVGLALGVAAAFVRERLDEQVREPSDIQDVLEVPILGSVPRFPERFRSPATALVTVHAPEGAQADAFRRLRASLLIALQDRNATVVAVTSPSAGDGKSTTAANLAVTLAQSGRSVMLVSADVRRPSLEVLFDTGPRTGLLDVLADEATFDEAIVPVGRFPLMTSGHRHSNPTDLLQSEAMNKLMADARSRFDLIIVDTPPVLAVADVLGMVPMLDAVLLVVSVDQTTEADVAQARTELEAAGADILGAVVNRSSTSTERYDAYYSGASPKGR